MLTAWHACLPYEFRAHRTKITILGMSSWSPLSRDPRSPAAFGSIQQSSVFLWFHRGATQLGHTLPRFAHSPLSSFIIAEDLVCLRVLCVININPFLGGFKLMLSDPCGQISETLLLLPNSHTSLKRTNQLVLSKDSNVEQTISSEVP